MSADCCLAYPKYCLLWSAEGCLAYQRNWALWSADGWKDSRLVREAILNGGYTLSMEWFPQELMCVCVCVCVCVSASVHACVRVCARTRASYVWVSVYLHVCDVFLCKIASPHYDFFSLCLYVVQFDLVCEKKTYRAHIHMAYNAGTLLGSPTSGFLCDWYIHWTFLYSFLFLFWDCSVQFNMVSTCSEKPIWAPPRLSEVSPMLHMKRFVWLTMALSRAVAFWDVMTKWGSVSGDT